MMLSLRPALLTAAVLLAASACGVSTSNSPETMSRDNLPEDLGGANPSSTVEPRGEGEIELWFVQAEGEDDRLVRRTVDGPVNSTAKVVMEALLQGPDDELAEDGRLRTAIPLETDLTDDPQLDGGVLVLDLPEEFYVDVIDRRLAFAQVVMTATEMDGVESVRFELDGVPQSATDGEGVEVPDNEPVTANDYRSLIAEGN